MECQHVWTRGDGRDETIFSCALCHTVHAPISPAEIAKLTASRDAALAQRDDAVKRASKLRAALEQACDGWEAELEKRKGRVGWNREQAPDRASLAAFRSIARAALSAEVK